ncbi:hypothetical protein ACFFGT_06515 [Mucilaginibacter angelicae]|uniref:Type II toxin-antitoxin system HicA family toxin n=1 Tax=Mucilaginibacter angelicae TaxID=869718 RepID=A0ABV6L318_9SPHI
MRARKPLDIEKALLKKGFVKDGESHHRYYYLVVDGKKTDLYTYLSHGKNSVDYGPKLMGKVKNQLRFTDSNKAELFLDCPMSKEQYIDMLKESDVI